MVVTFKREKNKIIYENPNDIVENVRIIVFRNICQMFTKKLNASLGLFSGILWIYNHCDECFS